MNDAMMVGGYSDCEVNDDYVVSAANFGVNALPSVFEKTPGKYTFYENIFVVEEGSNYSDSLDVVVLQAKSQVSSLFTVYYFLMPCASI